MYLYDVFGGWTQNHDTVSTVAERKEKQVLLPTDLMTVHVISVLICYVIFLSIRETDVSNWVLMCSIWTHTAIKLFALNCLKYNKH